MKTPLELSESQILNIVNASFGCNLSKIEFLPAGESSWVYTAIDEDGNKSFIKILKQPDMSTTEVLELLSNQYFKWMPRLVKSAQGKIWEEANGLYFSVQAYVRTDVLQKMLDKPNDEDLYQLGEALAELHSIRFNEVELPHVTRDNFDSPLIYLAHSAVDEVLKQENPNGTVISVKDCLISQKDSIEQLFINIERYGSELAQSTHNLVITHGDVHSGNILKSAEHLYLVDWDETMISLPEMDFKYFSDEQLMIISQAYGKDLLSNRIQIQYYRNLQMIRALWFWSAKLLATEGDEQESVSRTTIQLFDSSPYFRRALEKF